MCKKTFLFLVGLASFTLDGLENSAKEAEKALHSGIEKISIQNTQSEEENLNKSQEK